MKAWKLHTWQWENLNPRHLRSRAITGVSVFTKSRGPNVTQYRKYINLLTRRHTKQCYTICRYLLNLENNASISNNTVSTQIITTF